MSRRPYIRPVQRSTWWLKQPRYIRYMAREVSSAFLCAYSLVIVVGLIRLAQGEAAYDAYLQALWGNGGQILTLFTLVFAAYHTYSWFQVTPKAMPLRRAGKPVAGSIIVGAHWFGFLVASALIIYLVGM